mmetsp:Transcript_16419/g.29479  ORF Transcript_16419/g.29479 Transcript_16419/m.29479 type:complete len:232 (+) Transcript_16419:42-737(+)|eukprot:CAMPEP_0197522878 /NCGR_PEP_ID=MMETSP1318-20131121/7932_1 /TAXON_ID=552666 /ORGANISM="Partenskyella glossopodia, Strain RCC365" /LENGTH=231 /DNA_ID=CAMNT_0043075387 /DNA_START=42 /DNA_END=737 /DNA_ORIENTATION=-
MVSTDPKKLLAFIDNAKGYWIIQKYIERPMLVNGRKFDIRTWHLISALKPNTTLKVYTYDEGVLRLSSKKYKNSNFDDQFTHLTNNAIQQEHPEYGKNEKNNLLDLTDLDPILQKAHMDYKGESKLPSKPLTTCGDVIPSINRTVMDTLKCILDFLLPQPYAAYHLLGYDFMLTETGKVVLLEVNLTPGTSPDRVSRMVSSLVELCIDPEFDCGRPASESNAFKYVGDIDL